MRRLFFALVAAAAATLSLGAPAALAEEGAWRVAALEGVVRVAQPGRAAEEAHVSDALAAGATVTTGAGSRATLDNGAQRIVMTPNSRMTIAPASGAGMTRILQDVGALLFRVDHQDQQHFRVETPLLAAVVKGTTFTVSANAAEDTVYVSHGLVEVRANTGGAVRDVAAGDLARVGRNAPEAIAAAPAAAPQDFSALSVPALDYASASNGVVTAGAAQAPRSARGQLQSSEAGDRASSGHEGGVLSQSLASLRRMLASVTGASHASQNANQSSNAGGNGNANAGSGNSNAGGNGNASAANANAGGKKAVQ